VPGVFPASISMGTVYFSNQTGDWPTLYNPSTGLWNIIRASDGTIFPLLTGLNAFSFNPGCTRYATVTNTAGSYALREEALPPTNPASIAQATTLGFMAYTTPTRLFWLDTAVRRVIDVKSGVATIDSDVHPTNSMVTAQGLAVWSSATKWKVAVGDSPAVGLDQVPLTQPIQGNYGARYNTPVPTLGYITFDTSTAWVVDGAAGSARRSNVGTYAGLADRWGSTEIWRGAHAYTAATWVTAGATEQVIEVENLQGTTTLGPNFSGDITATAVSGKQLLMGWNR
jgi:hypothetical protein